MGEVLEIVDRHTDDLEMASDEMRANCESTHTDAVVNRDKVARRAYERFEARGGAHGLDQDDWYEAERVLRTENLD